MPKQKTLAAEIKDQVKARLKLYYPDVPFKLKSDSWSTGGSVDVKWVDGPSHHDVSNTLRGIGDGTIIHVQCERYHSAKFLSKVATEYCLCLECDPPAIVEDEDGYAHMDRRFDIMIARKIYEQCQRLKESDIATLAYKRHQGTGLVERSCVVRRYDYSHGKYPEYAIVRDNSYKGWERKLYYVRERINDNWVYIVQWSSIAYMDNALALEIWLDERKKYGQLR